MKTSKIARAEALFRLHNNADFKNLLAELRSLRPIVPPYNHREDNIEDMKFHSTRQQMFDTIMAVVDVSGPIPVSEQ
jgi:hypothetical protein